MGLKNTQAFDCYFLYKPFFFLTKKKHAKIFQRLFFSYNILTEYLTRLHYQIHSYNILKFSYWIKQFYNSFIQQSTSKFFYSSLKNKSLIDHHKKSFLNQFVNYKQHYFFVGKDIYIQKFILQRLLRNKVNLQNILLKNQLLEKRKKKIVFRKDLYSHSFISVRFCNMFMKKGHYGKIFRIFSKLNVYFKTMYGFEIIYLLILLLYLYKIPYGNKLKKKSGKTLNTPTHISIDRYFFQFFNLFKKAIKKRTELSIFFKLSNEIEALLLTNKTSFFFRDFSELIDYTLSGRTNLLQKKRRFQKRKKFKKFKPKKFVKKIKKYKLRKRRGLKSRVYKRKIKSYSRLISSVKKKFKKKTRRGKSKKLRLKRLRSTYPS